MGQLDYVSCTSHTDPAAFSHCFMLHIWNDQYEHDEFPSGLLQLMNPVYESNTHAHIHWSALWPPCSLCVSQMVRSFSPLSLGTVTYFSLIFGGLDWTQTVANTDWMGKQQQRVKSRTFVSACFCISVVQWRSTSSEWVMTHMILTLITSVYVISSPSIPIGPPLVLGMGCSLVCQK